MICISRITPCGTPYLSGSAGWRASRCDSHRRWPAGAGRLPPRPFLSDMPAPAPRFFCECPVDCVAGAPSFFHMEKARLVPKFTAHRPGDLRPVILPGWRRSGIVRRIVGVCACARSYVPGTLPPCRLPHDPMAARRPASSMDGLPSFRMQTPRTESAAWLREACGGDKPGFLFLSAFH